MQYVTLSVGAQARQCCDTRLRICYECSVTCRDADGLAGPWVSPAAPLMRNIDLQASVGAPARDHYQ